MEYIKPELIAKYTSKKINFFGLDMRINIVPFLLFFFHMATWTFYIFLASMVIGWILAFIKYDVVDFMILTKEFFLKLFKVSNIKKIRY